MALSRRDVCPYCFREFGRVGWSPHPSMKANPSYSVFESMEAFIPIYKSTSLRGWGGTPQGRRRRPAATPGPSCPVASHSLRHSHATRRLGRWMPSHRGSRAYPDRLSGFGLQMLPPADAQHDKGAEERQHQRGWLGNALLDQDSAHPAVAACRNWEIATWAPLTTLN
jgi:hypothetical protein